MKEFINLKQLIELTGLTSRQIQYQRYIGTLPFLKISSKKVIYPIDKIAEVFNIDKKTIKKIKKKLK
jgi:Ca2+/Na+ antiporter